MNIFRGICQKCGTKFQRMGKSAGKFCSFSCSHRTGHSIETKKKMSESAKKLWKNNDERKKNLSKKLTGRIFSEETLRRRKDSRSDIFGEKNPRWKGGKRKRQGGYIEVYAPDHPFCTKNKTVVEHRLVIEQERKITLNPWMQVHHINDIKDDNRLENLEVLTVREHRLHHVNERSRNNFGQFV